MPQSQIYGQKIFKWQTKCKTKNGNEFSDFAIKALIP